MAVAGLGAPAAELDAGLDAAAGFSVVAGGDGNVTGRNIDTARGADGEVGASARAVAGVPLSAAAFGNCLKPRYAVPGAFALAPDFRATPDVNRLAPTNSAFARDSSSPAAARRSTANGTT